jgi:hypothetical protein
MYSFTLKIGRIMTTQIQDLQKSITKNGKLQHSPDDFLKRKAALLGKTDLVTLGEPPPGFSLSFEFKPEMDKAALVAFLSAADLFGILISGMTKFDTIQFVDAAGIASFSEDIENEGIASFIGVVATGASVAVASFGAPEIIPVIKSAEQFAKERFKEEKVKTKRRDAFGVDPSSKEKARQEGGVVVSMPTGNTMQTFYSGDDSVEDKNWIKKPGDRTHRNLPDHMVGQGVFFLQPGNPNKEMCRHVGSILIYPWDHKFEDNFGFYRLHIILERHDSNPFATDFDPNVR